MDRDDLINRYGHPVPARVDAHARAANIKAQAPVYRYDFIGGRLRK